MGKGGQKAMKGLADEYPQFKSWYPYPKPLIHPRLLSVQQLTGVYSPFTVEANYNSEIPAYNIPHTICHELFHTQIGVGNRLDGGRACQEISMEFF